jgi:dTDP-4-amino-4,6-dideoxygalactose transaminase
MGSVLGREAIRRTKDVPLGGIKNRLNQCTSAVGLEQLKKYDREREEIEQAMLYYHKGISDIKGLKMIYPKWKNSNKAGWYSSRCLYDPAAFGGILNTVFAAALNAEVGGGAFSAGCNFPLHWSSVYDDEDIFGDGKPPVRRGLPAGVTPKQLSGKLPVSDDVNNRVIGDPWFKHFDKALIDRYIEAVHKVAANAGALKKFKGEAKFAYWS